MERALKIFAKKGTSEKVIIDAPREFVKDIQIYLGKHLGGDWLLVDDIHPGEFVHFSDTQEYNGYNPSIDRYSDAIKTIEL